MTSPEMMAGIAQRARVFAPRLFAVYGPFRKSSGALIVWGMEFARPTKVLAWSSDGAMWSGDTAEGLLRSISVICDAELVWLSD
ncbi:hypothetical protein [Actinokineospora sp. NPDC004072]